MENEVYKSFFELASEVIETCTNIDSGSISIRDIVVRLKPDQSVDLHKSQWGVFLLHQEYPEALERLKVLSIKTLKRELEIESEQAAICMLFMSYMTNIDTHDRLYELDTNYHAVICRNSPVNRQHP